MSEQHTKFLQRLAASQAAVDVVAKWLLANGETITVPKLRFAPTAAEASEYFDQGDIIITRTQRVEVRHLGCNFTGADDWPYRDEFFIGSVEPVDRAGDVAVYIFVSKDFSHIGLVVPKDTRAHWYKKEVINKKNTGNIETKYVCPTGLVKFKKLPTQDRRTGDDNG